MIDHNDPWQRQPEYLQRELEELDDAAFRRILLRAAIGLALLFATVLVAAIR